MKKRTAGQRNSGVTKAIVAAILWGVSGTCAQFLFERRGVSPEWLVAIRLLTAGVVLLLFASIRREKIFRIWGVKGEVIQLVIFSLLGMLAVQYTYFITIKYSNAATATILQFTGPVIIMLYLALRSRTAPKGLENLALVFAVTGTFLLVTHGKFSELVITVPALVWGLISAMAVAFYSIQPSRLLKKHSSVVVVGWGMLLGGIAISFVHPPWHVAGDWDLAALGNTSFVILFGTLVAFYLYMLSVKAIGAQSASLLASGEPLSATIISVFWLGVQYGAVEWFGSLLIISTVFLIVSTGRKAGPEAKD